MANNRTDRARGAMWGQAVGDALGTTVEFLEAASIARREPGAWPDELVGEGPFMLIPGQVTDDTELALALARSLIRKGRWDQEDVASSYLRWRASDPFDVGGATHQAFGKPVKEGSVAAAIRARASQNTQANGSLMRSSPLGIFGAGRFDREALAALARSDSTLSHPHAVTQAACAVFVTTIADAIEHGGSGPELHARALAFARGSAIADTLAASADAPPAVSDGENMGWVRLALQHAFFQLRHATDFKTALISTVRAGGDTDTNAAITGALLGASMGIDSIPRSWRDGVAACLSERPPEYRCGDLDAVVEGLLRA